MMGQQTGDQSQLFYLFNLEDRIPERHLLRRINPIVTRVLAELRETLRPFYSENGRPSIDPELMLRMLIAGYCYGIRFERRLCEEVELHLAYRWFCRLDLEDTCSHEAEQETAVRPVVDLAEVEHEHAFEGTGRFHGGILTHEADSKAV